MKRRLDIWIYQKTDNLFLQLISIGILKEYSRLTHININKYEEC